MRGTIFALALVITLAGCGKGEKTETMRVPKEGGAAATASPHGSMGQGGMSSGTGGGAMTGSMPSDSIHAGLGGGMPDDSIHAGLGGGMGDMSGMGGMGGAMAGGGGEPALHWHAPDTWTEKPPSSMRVGSYDVPGSAGPADMSVVVLTGEAGGNLNNVNRWRGQIGLGPIDDAELARAAKRVKSGAGDVLVVEFGGAEAGGKRMITGILAGSGQTWFFKLNGPDATVSGAREDFMKLVESVHAGSH